VSTVAGTYGDLVVVILPSGRVALDFTAKGKPGPYVTLNAIQWTALQRVVRSLPRRP
jgi:hypothetical protein